MVNHFRAHQILQRQLATVQKAEKMPSATVSIGLLCPRDVTGFRSFRDCGAWQRAYALRRAVIPALSAHPSSERLQAPWADQRSSAIGAERRALEHAARKAIKAANGLIRYLDSTPDP